jgi:tRNA G18 (ribose-2'-O)-methylase SpoU
MDRWEKLNEEIERTGKNEKRHIYGLRPVIEAVEAGRDIEKVFFKTGLKGDLFYSLVNLLKHMVSLSSLFRLKSSTGSAG